MKAVSERWRETIRQSHTMKVVVEVLQEGEIVQQLFPTEGQITFDFEAQFQSRMDVTLVDFDGTLTPQGATDMLTPLGTELKIKRGLLYPDGTEELVSLGIYGIRKIDVRDYGESVKINVLGYDRSQRISRARTRVNIAIPKGHDPWTHIQEILKVATGKRYKVNPDLEGVEGVIPGTTGTYWFPVDTDPWEAMQMVAHDHGTQLYINDEGFVDVSFLDDSDTPQVQHTFVEGDNCTLLHANKEYDNEETYNTLIVTGEPPTKLSPPVKGVAYDNDPLSPTYVNGPYGVVVHHVHSPIIPSSAAAVRVAKRMLQEHLGLLEVVRFSALADPSLELYDIVHVVRERVGVNAIHKVNTLSMPLVAFRGMEVTCMPRRLVAIEA